MQTFRGLGHGDLRRRRFLLLGKINALKCGRLLPIQWIHGRGGDQGVGKLMHHLDEFFRQLCQSETWGTTGCSKADRPSFYCSCYALKDGAK